MKYPTKYLCPPPIMAFVLVGLFASTATQTKASPPPGTWTLVWNDDFNGTDLDAAKWSRGPRTGDIIPGELQGYVPENVTVANGLCTIKVEKRPCSNTGKNGDTGGPRDYASGCIETYGKFTQTYGYIEARIRAATGPGTWPAIWLMPDRGAPNGVYYRTQVGDYVSHDSVSCPMGNEIDILEYMATWKNQTTGYSQGHCGYIWQYGVGASSDWTMVGQLYSPDTTFHTYGVAWSPGRLDYYIDGTKVSTKYGRSSVSVCPEYLIINCALTQNDWVSTVPLSSIDAGVPCTMDIDNVQVYSGTPDPVAIVNGTYETEAIVQATSTDAQSVVYDTAASNGAYEFLASNAPGDYIDYSVPVAQAGTYDVKVKFKRGKISTANRGQFQLSIGGVNQGAVQDEFGDGIFVEVDLGNVTFSTAGDKSFRFTVTGKNASSPGYNINMDYIKLTPVSSLPSPWVNQDIGSVGVAGSSSYSGGTFTINGSGTDISGTADSCQYVYQTATGDCSIIAKVESLVQTDYNAKAGVMMRQSVTDAGSPCALMYIPKLNKTALTTRSTSGGASTTVPLGTTLVHPPGWVKLTRVGNLFTGYYSTDGVNWTQVASQTIVMPSTIYMGLPATAHANTVLTTAVVSNVTAVP